MQQLDSTPLAGQISFCEAPEPKPPRFRDRAGLAASDGPISSHLAGDDLTISGRRASQKAEIVSWIRTQASRLTSLESPHATGMDRYRVARRLPDLGRDGLVERGDVRECTASHRPAITGRATENQ